MGKFKKILIVLSSKTLVDEKLIERALLLIEQYSTKKTILSKEEEEEEIEIVEKPTIFFRARKNDNIFRNRMFKYGLRFVQFRADWYQDNIMAGEIRNKKLFQFGLDHALIFTHSDENNKEGLQSIQYQAFLNSVPLKVYTDNKLSFDDCKDYPIVGQPIYLEEQSDEVKRILKINSEEYKRKMQDVSKRCKKLYYEGLKERPSIKQINFEDLNEQKPKKQKKVKLGGKASRKKTLKKEKQKKALKPITLDEELFD